VAGWIVTEVGRQPFTVYGLLRTAESASPIEAPAVAASLMAFIVVYFLLFGAGVMYILRILASSPNTEELPVGQPTRAAGTTPVASMLESNEAVPQSG
jgi:cytochrome d ubiquinol oxidase subunit I